MQKKLLYVKFSAALSLRRRNDFTVVIRFYVLQHCCNSLQKSDVSYISLHFNNICLSYTFDYSSTWSRLCSIYDMPFTIRIPCILRSSDYVEQWLLNREARPLGDVKSSQGGSECMATTYCWKTGWQWRNRAQILGRSKKFRGEKCLTLGRQQYFCLGGRFSKHKNLGVAMASLRPWLHLCKIMAN